MTPSESDPPIELSGQDWRELLSILNAVAPNVEVWAFGSRAKYMAKPYSDLDLVLITRQPMTLEQLANISEAFENSDLPIRVDVVDWAATSEAFRKIIVQDKVLVQPATNTHTP
jgi:predicted nucleotidyltransferase